MIAAAIVTGCFCPQYFQMNRQSVERRFHFVGEGARGDRQTLHRRRNADILALLHHQTVDQVQAGADFVVAGVSRTGGIGSRLGLTQCLADQTKTAGIERGGEKGTDESDAAAENKK